MRVKGYIQDRLMKITVLEMNNRTSLKFEYDLLEQTFKFTESLGIPDIEKKVNVDFRNKVMQIFQEMSEMRTSVHHDNLPEDNEFPIII